MVQQRTEACAWFVRLFLRLSGLHSVIVGGLFGRRKGTATVARSSRICVLLFVCAPHRHAPAIDLSAFHRRYREVCRPHCCRIAGNSGGVGHPCTWCAVCALASCWCNYRGKFWGGPTRSALGFWRWYTLYRPGTSQVCRRCLCSGTESCCTEKSLSQDRMLNNHAAAPVDATWTAFYFLYRFH